mgnify:CR=1 FL=1
MTAHIQFIKGIDEKVLPDIRLTRSRDGSTGTATFRFKNANILDKSLVVEYFLILENLDYQMRNLLFFLINKKNHLKFFKKRQFFLVYSKFQHFKTKWKFINGVKLTPIFLTSTWKAT